MAKKRMGWLGGFLYWLRYRIGEYCLRGFVVILPWLPIRFLSALTKVAAQLSFVLLWNYRKRMEENISMAMGNKLRSQAERKALVRTAWRNFAQGLCESACTVHTAKERICSSVAIQGEEHLKRALAREKGVIALSAHLGNFVMIGTRLAATGYPFSVIVKQPRDQGLARLMDEYRSQVGIHTISARPRREAARQIVRALRKNRVVLLVADEFKSGGVEVEFLGRAARAPRGPATLALRTGAPVVPMFVTRDQEDRLTLRIEPEIDLIKTGNMQEDVPSNVALLTRALEAMVRRYPDQWNWLGFSRNGTRSRAQMGTSETTQSGQQGRLAS